MTTQEVAEKLKINPKNLRSILRSEFKMKGPYDLKANDVAKVEKHLAAEPEPKK